MRVICLPQKQIHTRGAADILWPSAFQHCSVRLYKKELTETMVADFNLAS